MAVAAQQMQASRCSAASAAGPVSMRLWPRQQGLPQHRARHAAVARVATDDSALHSSSGGSDERRRAQESLLRSAWTASSGSLPGAASSEMDSVDELSLIQGVGLQGLVAAGRAAAHAPAAGHTNRRRPKYQTVMLKVSSTAVQQHCVPQHCVRCACEHRNDAGRRHVRARPSYGPRLNVCPRSAQVSGEALQGQQGFGVDPEVLQSVAAEVAEAWRYGVRIAIVVRAHRPHRRAWRCACAQHPRLALATAQRQGAPLTSVVVGAQVGGGNFFRGVSASKGLHMERATADTVGMIATCMNALCLQVRRPRVLGW